jgi:hypothetical protein
MGLDHADDDVGPPFFATVPLTQHGVRFADPWRRTQIDPQ